MLLDVQFTIESVDVLDQESRRHAEYTVVGTPCRQISADIEIGQTRTYPVQTYLHRIGTVKTPLHTAPTMQMKP